MALLPIIVAQDSQDLFCPNTRRACSSILLQASCMRATARVHETCEIFCVPQRVHTHSCGRIYAFTSHDADWL